MVGGPGWQQSPLSSILPGQGLMEGLPPKALEFSSWKDFPSIVFNFLGSEAHRKEVPNFIWELVPGQSNGKMGGVVLRLGPKGVTADLSSRGQDRVTPAEPQSGALMWQSFSHYCMFAAKSEVISHLPVFFPS